MNMLQKRLAHKYPDLGLSKAPAGKLDSLYKWNNEQNTADKAIAALIILKNWRARKENREILENLSRNSKKVSTSSINSVVSS